MSAADADLAGELHGITATSGVTAALSGFCPIIAEGLDVDGRPVTLKGQLTPAETRLLGLRFIEAAEAAEADAALACELVAGFGFELPALIVLLDGIRRRRQAAAQAEPPASDR